MGEIVNLKLARKRKARTDKDDRAAANRALFGRTRAEKAATDAEHRRAAAALEGHRREPDSGK